MKIEMHDPELRVGSTPKEGSFHRVVLTPNDVLTVTPHGKPVAVWVPSGYEVQIVARRGVVLDLAEAVEHHDVVSMERRLREKDKQLRAVVKREKRARRKLRGLDRVP